MAEVVVEIDVYSGRPNPTWTLGSAEQEQVSSLIEGLPETSSRAGPAATALGFRGFIVDGLRVGSAGAATVVVWPAYLDIRRPNGAVARREDADDAVMTMLIELALTRIEDPALAALLRSWTR